MPKQNPYKNPIILAGEEDKIMKKVRDQEEKTQQDMKIGEPTQYHYSYVGMEEVMRNPDEYIIPELQTACKKLWSMNIFTFMCSDRNDGGHSYILLEKLSDENQAIFDEIRKEHPKNFIFSQYRNCYGIDFNTENLSEQEISEKFEKAISCFKQQDIQKPFYITREQFLLDCGCYSEVPNPKFVEDPGPMPIGTDLKALDEWFAKVDQPKMLKVFDETKVVKPIEEYLKEKNITTYDPKTQRIYQSEFFLKRHLDYVEKSSHSEDEMVLAY